MAAQPWTYRAAISRVVDADTFVVELDLGFNTYRIETLRLAGLDAPERNTPEGAEAKGAVASWIADLSDAVYPVLVTTAKTDKYGRYVATVSNAAEPLPTLNDYLLQGGWAQPYPAPRT